MTEKQITLLAALAKRIKTERKDRDKVVASLRAAKILTKNGNFTGHYRTLKKTVSE